MAKIKAIRKVKLRDNKIVRDNKGRFEKGSCPNPGGTARVAYKHILEQALYSDDKKHREHFIEYAIRLVRVNPGKYQRLFSEILKKILPDKMDISGIKEKIVNLIVNGSKQDRVFPERVNPKVKILTK